MSWINNEVVPVRVSDVEWWLQDSRNGATIAIAKLSGGRWVAELKSSLCGELMGFLKANAATPTDAFYGVFDTNIRAALEVARDLSAFASRFDPAGFDEPQDVMAETIATAAM